MRQQILPLILLVLTVCLPAIARGEDPAQETPSPRISDVRLKGDEGDEKKIFEFGLFDTLLVTVENWKPLEEELTKEVLDQWVLQLDGITLPETSAIAIDTTVSPGKAIIRFHLKRNESNRVQWNALLHRPIRGRWVRPIRVGIQAPLKFGEIAPWTEMKFVVLDKNRAYPLLVVMLIVIALLVRMGFKTNMLRGTDGVYSLSRTQMAWWFVIILGSYLVLGVLTYDWTSTISDSALILMGIAGATSVGATVIEGDKEKRKAKREGLLKEIKELQKKIQLVSDEEAAALRNELVDKTKELDQYRAAGREPGDKQTAGFVEDIISDKAGVSLYRFQNVVWTVVLGVCFALSVLADLSMPEFSTAMLSLMGLSSGTYIALKASAQEPT